MEYSFSIQGQYNFPYMECVSHNLQISFPKMKNLSFDWNDLKFFLATARSGGLSSAALELDTSPSTVSRHLVALEKRLGTNLFLRLQSGYLLTDDGSALLKQVEQVEQAMLSAERSGRPSLQEEVSGTVCLATTETLATYLIVPQLPLFRASYPKLQVEIKISLQRANLSRREADLALRVSEPIMDSASADYIASRVSTLDFGAYCAAGMLSKKDAAKPSAWKTLDYISWDESWTDLPMSKWLGENFADKPAALVCNSVQAQYAAMKSGLGVGVLPCFVGDRDAQLQRVGSPEPLLSRDLWLLYHRDLKASQRVLAMRDFVRQLVQSHMK
jgi:DNA-binding transcriptional LysR family regulator